MAILAIGAVLLIALWSAPRPVKNLYLRWKGFVAPIARLASLSRDSQVAHADDGASLRLGRSTVAGAILTLPPKFKPASGVYDLVIHFHGNVGLVEESYAVAGIDAAVVIVNAGVTSGVYDQRFSGPAVLPAVLARVDDELVRRGLPQPKRGRVALSAWSAGYGAVARILESDQLGASLDAIVLLDGFHSAYDRKREIDVGRLAPFKAFAERAIRGERFLSITHSEIDPYTYPGTRPTTDALLRLLGLTRTPGGATPELPALSQMHGIPRDKLVRLVPTSECHAGDFHVRGFAGTTPEDHMAHLAYMGSTALPDLAKRWAPAAAAASTKRLE